MDGSILAMAKAPKRSSEDKTLYPFSVGAEFVDGFRSCHLGVIQRFSWSTFFAECPSYIGACFSSESAIHPDRAMADNIKIIFFITIPLVNYEMIIAFISLF